MYNKHSMGEKLVKPLLALSLLFTALLFSRCESLSKGLDSTFGSGGIVTTAIGTSDDRIYAVAVLSDGRILAAGTSYDTKLNFAVARYLSNGSLDTSFASGNGKMTQSVGSGDDSIFAIVALNDGSFFVAGSTTVSTGNTDFVLARFFSDGTLDTNFGSSGFATRDFGLASAADVARALLTDGNGRLVVVGQSDDGTQKDFAVARYETTGTPDTTFDSDGFATYAISTGDDTARGIVVDEVGRLIVVGQTPADLALLRLKTSGALDTGFDTDGIRVVSITSGADVATSVQIRSGGEILVGGVAREGSSSDALLSQFHTDGSTDLDFGTNGTAVFSLTTAASRSDAANAMVLAVGDKPVFVGKTNNGSNFDWLLSRVRFSGSQDFTFDTDGFFSLDFSGGLDEAHAVALQNDGKILVAGEAHNGSNADFALIRYEP
ncbi:MAG: delta-60 repeat domain-containing protein [Bdellovibrionota bacterium]